MDIITLFLDYFSNLLDAEVNFYEDPGKFTEFERTVGDLSNEMAAKFIGSVLTEADQIIRESGIRKSSFTVQRTRQRTLISTVGDIHFSHTVYRDGDGKCYSLLDRLLHLPGRERFTALAEAKVISEAEVHSYQHAADSIKTNGESITKQTVMNKEHAIITKGFPMPDGEPAEKKQCEYLYIEADEDHIHRQKDGENHGCFYGKLVYVFEGKEETCDGRRKLINCHYFGGLYPGSEGNAALWKEVDDYIRKHYDGDYLKCVYINSDGGSWIRAGARYVYKSRLVADKYHLMKYIYRVAGYTLDDRDETIARFYRYIHKNQLEEALKLLDEIQENCEGSDKAVNECRTYLSSSWRYIWRAYHDSHALGCSAEGHVSHVYSERMSSRPMGWGEVGANNMCQIRCYVRNYERDNIIDLVEYRREMAIKAERGTGTDGISLDTEIYKKHTRKQVEEFAYAQSMFAKLSDKAAVRKALAIREQIWI